MAPSSPPASDIAVLLEISNSTLTLLDRFKSALLTPSPAYPPSQPSPPDPLSVLHDASKLLRAHTTKVSLLVINKPFTPSAIRKIVAEVANTCIPAMMSAVEICTPARYGKLCNHEVKVRVRRVFAEFGEMLEEVISKAEEEGAVDGKKGKKREERSRDSLASTGVVWEACDSLMELKSIGIAGLVVRKAVMYRDTLEDAIAELQEWGQEEDEDEGFEDGDAVSDQGSEFEDMLGTDKLPKDRPDLKDLLLTSVKKLKLVSTLYQALVKRRFKTMGAVASPHNVAGCEVQPIVVGLVDSVMDHLMTIPDQTDDLASAFYDLDEAEVKKTLKEICKSAKEAVDFVRVDWSSKEDEFSIWSRKWISAVDQA